MHDLRIVLPLCILREQYLILVLLYVSVLSLPHQKGICTVCLHCSFVVLLYDDGYDVVKVSQDSFICLLEPFLAVQIVLGVDILDPETCNAS